MCSCVFYIHSAASPRLLCDCAQGPPQGTSRGHSRSVSRTTSVMEGASVRSPSGTVHGLPAALDSLSLGRQSQTQLQEGVDGAGRLGSLGQLPPHSPNPSFGGSLVEPLRPSAFMLNKSSGAAELSEAVGLQLRSEIEGSGSAQVSGNAPGKLGRQSGSVGASGMLLNSMGSLGSASSLPSMDVPPMSPPLASASTGAAEGPSSGSILAGTPAVSMGGAGPGGIIRRVSLGVSDSPGALSGPFTDADIFTPLAPQLGKLWHLFEMVLLGKPLLVVGPSPADCAGAVGGLLSLIAPLPYAPDFRWV